MIVYHGSDHIIEVPVFNGSKRTNDYGYGFYTTENPELAKEWACTANGERVSASVYYEKKTARDLEARRAYRNTKRSKDSINELFILDIMREGITNGDPRLR